MKSERKQIQESNLLADKIEAQIIKFKQVLPGVIALVVVSLVALLGYGLYSTMQEGKYAKGWTALYFADTDTSDLNAISSDFDGTPAGLWARQTAGDAYLARALEKVYLDRDLSDQYYKQAIEEYKAVAEKTSEPFLKGRALFGLAQAFEGVSDREQAMQSYRKISLIKGLGPEFLAEASKRTGWLESSAGEEFYTWFKNNRPSAPVLNDVPATKLPLPGSPDISFPSTVLPGSALPEIPSSSTNAADTKPSNNDLPVVPVPPTSTPDPTPAPTEPATKPAEETPAEPK
jgi:tetratricopeptide (TPR) repeat protein